MRRVSQILTIRHTGTVGYSSSPAHTAFVLRSAFSLNLKLLNALASHPSQELATLHLGYLGAAREVRFVPSARAGDRPKRNGPL